jgi:GAF domain-containing protein
MIAYKLFIIHADTSTSSREFSQEDLMLYDTIENAAGIAVENAQLYREKIQNENSPLWGRQPQG